ncbi:MAG: dihydroorotase, partial [Propionibacteriaceae bacterium]
FWPVVDVEALLAVPADGTIDCVATDHAPHARHDKEHAFAEAAFGMLGLETALAVVVQTMIDPGRLDWAGVAQAMSHRPATIARLGQQGRPLTVGEPAHLLLVDPTRRAVVDRATSASLSRNNPYHGRNLPDPVVTTVWAGRVTYGGERERGADA